MGSNQIRTTTDRDFGKDVLQNTRPSLVDFWATWCAPCRALAPVIDEIAAQYASRVDVFKVDIDSNPETPARFGVRGIPTVILFNGGEAVDRVVGAVPKSEIERMIGRAFPPSEK